MEGVAWATHRYIMHGPLWVLHKSHHRPRKHVFELNDLFGVFFSAVSIILIAVGQSGSPALLGIGIGMAVYGLIYFLLHDILVHRRIPGLRLARLGPLKRVYQAHRLHHATRERDGAVSFGFVWSRSPGKLKQDLRRIRGG